MAKKRLVNTRFWTDSYILSLTAAQRLVFIWAITNPMTELCGAYETAIDIIKLQTGLDEQTIMDAFAKFTDDDKITYRAGWVIVRNFTRHQNGTSTNIRKGAQRSLSDCPDWVKDTLSKGMHIIPVDTLPRPRPEPEPEPEPNGVCVTRTRASEVFREDERANPVSEEERIYIDTVMDGLRDRLGTVVLRGEREWLETIEFARMNKIPAEAVLETYDLLRRQHWRTGRVTARTVGDNLTELETLRKETKNGKTKPDKTRSTADFLASIGAKPRM